MFSRCSDAELAELAKLFVELPGTGPDTEVVLFDIGQPADAMYLLVSGSAVLESPEDELHFLYPPALLGELGALTSVVRSTKVTVRDAKCYRADALVWQQFLFEHHGFGMRVLRDVLRVAAEKIHRDQVRLGTMRQNSQWTQDGLREVLAAVKGHPRTPISATVQETVESLIVRNRRINVRVTPSVTMPASLVIDGVAATVAELSSTHLSFGGGGHGVGERVAGTLTLAGRGLAIAGKVIRASDTRVTLELEPLVDEDRPQLEGYLTRAQLLDILL